jgi:hypothetical protein
VAQSPAVGDVASAEFEFGCYVSERVSNGTPPYRYGRLTLHFPRSARAPHGESAAYQVIQTTVSGDILGAANCRIPDSPEAFAAMSRWVARLRARGSRSPSIEAPTSRDPVVVARRGDAVVADRPRMMLEVPLPTIYVIALPGLLWGGGAGGSCDYDPTMSQCMSSGPDYGGSSGAGYGGGAWNPDWPIVPCRTGNEFVDAPGVSVGLSTLWKASNVGAPSIGDHHEQGGWIVRGSDGALAVVPWNVPGTVCGIDAVVSPPPGGWGTVVGYVHTHPYLIGDAVPVCLDDPNVMVGVTEYSGAPSDIDRNLSVTLGKELPWPGRPNALPGIAIDANGVSKFSGFDRTADVRSSRCGY